MHVDDLQVDRSICAVFGRGAMAKLGRGGVLWCGRLASTSSRDDCTTSSCGKRASVRLSLRRSRGGGRIAFRAYGLSAGNRFVGAQRAHGGKTQGTAATFAGGSDFGGY